MMIGGLTGKRAENMVYITRSITGPLGKEKSVDRVSVLIQDMKKSMGEEDRGMNVVGWYIVSPDSNLTANSEIERLHRHWKTTFPGSFLIRLDPGKILTTQHLKDYLTIFAGEEDDPEDVHLHEETMNVDVDLRLADIIRAISSMVNSTQIPDTQFMQKEKKAVKIKRKIHRRKPSGAEEDFDPLVEIDRISREVLKLKNYLAKLKQGMDSNEHENRDWYTKRIKFLKLKQLSLSDSINSRIRKISDIQMRIAFYKVRDSLSIDMKLLDEMINEQYMLTLTELVRMGAEKSE